MNAAPGRTPTLLLVSPAFHGYHRSIAAAFEDLGYVVRTHCYDSYASWGEKVRNKVAHELPARVGLSRWGSRTVQRPVRGPPSGPCAC